MNNNQNIGEIFLLALQNHKKNNLSIAQKFYNEVLTIDPHHLDTLTNLGVIFINLGENEKAISYNKKVIKINPNNFNAYNNLGVAYMGLGEIEKAISCYEKAIEINPSNLTFHNNLGKIFYKSGEYLKALRCFGKVAQIDPNNIELVINLTELFRVYEINKIINHNSNNLEQLFLFLMKKNNIFHGHIINNIITFLLETKKYNQIKKIINSESSLLMNQVIQDLLKEDLFNLVLQRSFPMEISLEKLLTKLRYEILFSLSDPNQNLLEKNFDFIISLAEQCWLNEFVYMQSEKEIEFIIKLKNKIENNIEINELEITILGCFVPLNSSKIIINKLLNYQSTNILFNDLINIQIKEPLKEIELAKSIKSLAKIIDPVSTKVKEQYEENPYPRWRYTNVSSPNIFFRWLNAEIKPNKIDYNNNFDKPDILIAGCGTGNHSISATKYQNANILAIDLSLTSLAYAKRKTEELELKNIEYLQADILQLKSLDKKFDVIECSGTLHHMKNPVEGFKVLLDVLKPQGFLKIGLYSQRAREHVVKVREFIKKKNFKNSLKDIRVCRQILINNNKDQLLAKAAFGFDFYSTSSVRDLLFHIQEHRFTIPEISTILKDLNLEFLGFIYPNPLTKKEFSKLFPDDKNNISLENWDKFEEKYPDTFANMYQFWVRKN